MKLILLFLSFTLIQQKLVTSDSDKHFPVTRTPVGLEKWVHFEMDLVTYLNQTLHGHGQTLKDVRGVIQSYITDFEDSFKNLQSYTASSSPLERVKGIASNPLAVFRMVRRVAYDLPDLQQALKSYPLFARQFPAGELTYKDVTDAIVGILRISHVYDFNAASISKGILGELHTGVTLKAVHCYEIAIQAIPNQFYNLAIEWLELALRKTFQGDRSVPRALVKAAVDEAIEKHDAAFDEPPYPGYPNLFDRKLGPLKDLPTHMFQREKMRNVYLKRHSGDPNPNYNHINFWKLCSTGSYQSQEEISQLFCWYESSSHPYWKVGPLKMELLAKYPDILQIYDIIGDERMQMLKEIVSESLVQSPVVDYKSTVPGATKLSKFRTSVNGWVNEFSYPRLRSLLTLIGRATGLDTSKETSGDMLQVASYTFGGHYDVHIDTLINDPQFGLTKGDRIATFMFYLEQPELGGYTAFPQAGARAMPIKGSAVFWYDVLSDESPDYSSYHGACPVIIGQKWVANKWIRYKDQFVTRKCGLRPSQRYSIVANNSCSSM